MKNLNELEKIFLALADKTRLRLLSLMREQEICVCFFSEILNESQPKISRHLAYLRNAELVEARRDGKWMHYRIVSRENPVVEKILNDSLDAISDMTIVREDFSKLRKICCAAEMPVSIARAPTPQLAQTDGNSEQQMPEQRKTTEPEIEIYLL